MNIIDFVSTNGDKTFNELPFNEIDGLVFSELAYLNYENIFTSFKEVVDSKDLNSYETSILLCKNNFSSFDKRRELVRLVLNSKRYYGMKFLKYINCHDFDSDMQFGAISFIFNDFICISFKGTDDTLLGWKEDFAMSYSNFIASQVKGVEYLESIIDEYDKDLILVGHSKGGNIAIYSGVNCRESYQSKIKEIYSYDSPGFNKNFIESKKYFQTQNKIKRYLPESSFIGVIMYNDDNYNIVASNKLFIFQHNAYNWLVDNDKFILKEKLSDKSLAFLETNRKWIENFTDNERKVFFDIVFQLLEYKNEKTIMDYKKNFKCELNRIIFSSKEISKENKDLMINIIKNLFSTYLILLFGKKKY